MIVCPFCGLATELPHETQTACIEALHEEISHVRDIVERLKDATRATEAQGFGQSPYLETPDEPLS